MGSDYHKYLIILLVIAIALFFILRELNCWYWKINQRIKLMEEQNRLLNLLVKQNESSDNRNRNEGNKTTDNAKTAETKETSDAIIQEIVPRLKELIDKEKNKGLFGKSIRQEIINYLEEYCQSKNNCIQIIKVYQTQFNSDLIEDLKKLSSSFDAIKETLTVFIKYDVVESAFPHNRK